jgi:transposase-like protein
MKIVDTKSRPASGPFRVRVNRTGRRTFSPEYKLEVVEECSAPGASVAGVALSHRINANLVRRWIVLHRAGRLCNKPAMLPVTVTPTGPMVVAHACDAPRAQQKNRLIGVLEIELTAARIRVRGAVDATVLRIAIELLK